MRFLIRIQRWILDTLFPPHCVSCKSEGDFLCEACLAGLQKQKIRSGQKKGMYRPSEFKYLDGVIYALDYAKNPSIKAAIEQFKYRFNQELAVYFSDLILEKLKELKMAQNKIIHLIPVPLHKKRLNWRGFNQAKVIAQALKERALTFNLKVTPLLERIRHTDQQAKLGRQERLRNLVDAFHMNKKFVQYNPDPNHLYFLVDDVCSTGATLENGAKALKEKGFNKIYGLVVARAFK